METPGEAIVGFVRSSDLSRSGGAVQRRSRVAAALRAAVTPEGHQDLSILARAALERPGELVASAVWHGVAGSLKIAVDNLEDRRSIDALTRAGLNDICRAQFARHARMSVELGQLGAALAGASIPWVALKGPVLAELVYPRPDLRSYVDLDLLVAPAHLGKAIEALEGFGCGLLVRNWPLAGRLLPGEILMTTPGGTLVDLHWHVINDRRARLGASLSTEDLIRRRRMVSLAGLTVPTLDPVSTAVHLGVHAAQSGANRLSWLVDLARALELTDLDLVIDSALDQGVAPMVEVVLRRTRAVLGTPLDGTRLRQLMPAADWRAISCASAYLPPVPRSTTRGSVARMVARAARSDARSSRRELVRRAMEWSTSAIRTPATGDLWDPENPESMLFDGACASGRQEYLDAVERESHGSPPSRLRTRLAPSRGSL